MLLYHDALLATNTCRSRAHMALVAFGSGRIFTVTHYLRLPTPFCKNTGEGASGKKKIARPREVG